MAAEFDAEQPIISNFGERRDNRRKIDFAVAEHEVLVNTSLHIFDVDVYEPVSRRTNFLGNWEFSLTVEMADVDREAKARCVVSVAGKSIEQLVVTVDRINK